MASLSSFLSGFDGDEKTRAHFILLTAPFGVVVSLGLTVFYFSQGAPPRSLEVITTVVALGLCVCVVAGFFLTRSFELVAHFFAVVETVVHASSALVNDDLSYAVWLVIVPLSVFFMAGTRAGLTWLVISLVVSTGVILSVAQGGVHPLSTDLSRVVRTIGLLPVVSVIAALFQLSRSRALTELKAARDAAENASHHKSRFLAAVSHEIRTPLNGILSMTELMLTDESLSRDVRGNLSLINESGATLVALINDLLDLSKIEAGRIELVSRPFCPYRAVKEVVALHQTRANAKKIALSSSCDFTGALWLLGDGVRVRQVLHNLVSNAVKFTEKGEVKVAARAVTTGDEVRLEVDVTDTGRGISPGDMQRLFTDFAQLRSDDSRLGTGLGLVLSRTLVEKMGGALTARSTPGEGSTFSFTLTLESASAQSTPLGGVPVTTLRRGRVLVVDDNPVNLKVAVGMLHRLGLNAEQVTDGGQALERLAHERFDLVLMDLQMPVMSGLEVTRRVRATEAAALHTPIVALTASAQPEELQSCLDAGMDACLTKPLELAKLRDMLEAYMPGPAASPAPRA